MTCPSVKYRQMFPHIRLQVKILISEPSEGEAEEVLALARKAERVYGPGSLRYQHIQTEHGDVLLFYTDPSGLDLDGFTLEYPEDLLTAQVPPELLILFRMSFNPFRDHPLGLHLLHLKGGNLSLRPRISSWIGVPTHLEEFSLFQEAKGFPMPPLWLESVGARPPSRESEAAMQALLQLEDNLEGLEVVSLEDYPFPRAFLQIEKNDPGKEKIRITLESLLEKLCPQGNLAQALSLCQRGKGIYEVAFPLLPPLEGVWLDPGLRFRGQGGNRPLC